VNDFESAFEGSAGQAGYDEAGECDHEEVETDDGRDGVAGRIRHFCQVCDSEVILIEPDEDGIPGWEVA
jgi:hypothetical protein